MQQQVLKSRGMQLVEQRTGRPIDVTLRELYLDQGLTVDAVAETLGITKGTVSRWLAHFGIRTRYLVSDRNAA